MSDNKVQEDYCLTNEAITHNNALSVINNKELDECLVKFGSFLSIVQTKKINPTNYLLILVSDSTIRNILLQITGIDTFEELVRELIARYPILCKSKIIRNQIKRIRK
jgi:hypothetical protein